MDTRKLIVPFLLCCLALTLFLGTVKIGHATPITVDRTFASQTYDGYAYVSYGTYVEAWVEALGTVVDNSVTSRVGQRYYGAATYRIDRSFLYFDTSMIPTSANITNAILGLCIQGNYSTTDFNVTIQHSSTYSPHTPLESIDYFFEWYNGNGGSRNTSSITSLDYWNITLNNDGIDWIDVNGTTQLCLRSNKDIDATAPTGDEYITFYSVEQGSAYAPLLFITYEFEGNSYTVHGPYYENGSVVNGTVTVTLQIENMADETEVLNGTDGVADTYAFQVEQLGITLSWNISTSYNNTRCIWLTSATSQEYWIFVPDTDKPCYLYTLTLNDFVGITDATLESQTVLSGFLKTVEREPFVAGNSMPFYLSWGRHYTFVLSCDKGTKTWVNIVPSSATDIQLVITLDDFPIMLQTLNVSISVIRQNNTWVSVSYSDSDFETTNGTVTIWHSDNYTDTTDNVTTWNGDTLSLDWYSAEETVDYWVNITATKNGQTYNWVLTAPHVITVEPWAGIFDPFGVWPVPSQYLAGAFVLFTVMALFTQANMAGGLIFSVIVAAILNYIRWLNVSWSLIAVAFAMAIIVALEEARKKHAVGA